MRHADADDAVNADAMLIGRAAADPHLADVQGHARCVGHRLEEVLHELLRARKGGGGGVAHTSRDFSLPKGGEQGRGRLAVVCVCVCVCDCLMRDREEGLCPDAWQEAKPRLSDKAPDRSSRGDP